VRSRSTQENSEGRAWNNCNASSPSTARATPNPHLRILGQAFEGEAGIAEDAYEQVVEVVGDATREHGETLKLLGLLEAVGEAQPVTIRLFEFRSPSRDAMLEGSVQPG
jgi:hypothetical protein